MTRVGLSVVLETYELQFAAIVGVMRRIQSLSRPQWTNKVQNRDFGWHTDIEGACAEMAFAKATGNYWNTSNYWQATVATFRKPDVGGFQVKHTQHQNGSLVVQQDALDEDLFALVVGTSPRFRVCGAIYGKDAKTFPLRDPTNVGWFAHFVPQENLHDLSDP